MRAPHLLYGVYERKLLGELSPEQLPQHVAVMLDGNRRWAKSVGATPEHGWKRGADKITELLTWSKDVGIPRVTLWMLSTDNLQRDPDQVHDLLEVIVGAVEALAADPRWRVHCVGALELLPQPIAQRILIASSNSADGALDGALDVNVAIGYGGRHEIIDAVRAFLRDQAEQGLSLTDAADALTVDDIAANLYTAGQPDPDLVIRTSGEQRLSGFLLWQSVHSEYYFCDAYWPDFRRVDYLRALRSYAQRERRLGR
ncbi:MAG: polyprenyl diphosphate synthase [Ruaniaceae bacterium]|nr:polyprenyl diphosphate synthase [Ruaniaceae bacterium]